MLPTLNFRSRAWRNNSKVKMRRSKNSRINCKVASLLWRNRVRRLTAWGHRILREKMKSSGAWITWWLGSNVRLMIKRKSWRRSRRSSRRKRAFNLRTAWILTKCAPCTQSKSVSWRSQRRSRKDYFQTCRTNIKRQKLKSPNWPPRSINSNQRTLQRMKGIRRTKAPWQNFKICMITKSL